MAPCSPNRMSIANLEAEGSVTDVDAKWTANPTVLKNRQSKLPQTNKNSSKEPFRSLREKLTHLVVDFTLVNLNYSTD